MLCSNITLKQNRNMGKYHKYLQRSYSDSISERTLKITGFNPVILIVYKNIFCGTATSLGKWQ